MKKVNLNCIFGALAPGLNEVEDDVADRLINGGYATLIGEAVESDSVSKEQHDALQEQHDALQEQVTALTVERDNLLTQVAMLGGGENGKKSNSK